MIKKFITLLVLLTANQLYCQNMVNDSITKNRFKKEFSEADSVFASKFHKPKYDTVKVKMLISEEYNPFSREINGFIVYELHKSTVNKNVYRNFVKYLNYNKKDLPNDFIVWEYIELIKR